MCSECVFRSGDHTNHLQDVVLIKKAFPKVKLRINELVVEFEKSIKEIKVNELNLYENKKSIENLNVNCKGQIGKMFNDVREALRVKEMELIGSIESVVEREVRAVEKELQVNGDKRGKIEGVSRLLNSVQEVQSEGSHVHSFEKEIEILDSFSEMKSVVSESRSELLKNDLNLVQLFIPNEQVARMGRKVDHIREAIMDLSGVVPSRNAPVSYSSSSTPNTTASFPTGFSREGSVISSSGRKKKSVKRTPSTAGDMFLMNAIDDAMRAS